ncbi:hypothetical protein BPORC_1835 [Bifidobacterium porcinum]|nr:hypothetical protein BPORC_1835 [Bifidobacterium porcinum]
MVPQTRLQQMFPTVIPRRKSRPPSFSNPSRRLLRRNRQPCKCRLPSSRLRRHIKFRAISRFHLMPSCRSSPRRFSNPSHPKPSHSRSRPHRSSMPRPSSPRRLPSSRPPMPSSSPSNTSPCLKPWPASR